jgi:hypothetical protein
MLTATKNNRRPLLAHWPIPTKWGRHRQMPNIFRQSTALEGREKSISLIIAPISPRRDSPAGFPTSARKQACRSSCKLSAVICCPILTKLGICRQILAKLANFKFHENLFSGSLVVTYRQTNMAEQNGAILLRLVTEAPENKIINYISNFILRVSSTIIFITYIHSYTQ